MIVRYLKAVWRGEAGFWVAYGLGIAYCVAWYIYFKTDPLPVAFEVPPLGKIIHLAVFLCDLTVPLAFYPAWKSVRVRHVEFFLLALPLGAYVLLHALWGVILFPFVLGAQVNSGGFSLYLGKAINLIEIGLAVGVAYLGWRRNARWHNKSLKSIRQPKG